MSLLFWAFAVAMLIVAIGFVAVPLQTGRSLFATPKLLVVAFIPLSAVCLYAFLGPGDEIGVQHVATGPNSGTTRSPPWVPLPAWLMD